MKIAFWGTGAAEGVPAEFCDCKNCIAIRKSGEAFRTRSQVVIDGSLSVDFPPDAFAHSLKYGVSLSEIAYLLVTHSHMDHFYAHDFVLRGYKYAEIRSAPKLFIYGNAEVGKVFSECTAREMKPQVAPNVAFIEISPYSELKIGDYRVLAIPANHGKSEDALLYYISRGGKGYLHLYDTGLIEEKAYDFLAERGAKADLVAFDCTFGQNTGGAGARHMGICDDMQVRDELLKRGIIGGGTRLVITHFSHNCNPTRENLRVIEEKYGVTAAYDGYTVEI